MTTLKSLIQKIVAAYDPNSDEDFAPIALDAFKKHFANMKPSTSKTDPERLATQSTTMSHLRSALIEKYGPVDIDNQPEFNKLDIQEQLQEQKRAQITGSPKWLIRAQIIPDNLKRLAIPIEDRSSLEKHRTKVNTERLREDMIEVDIPLIMNKLMPSLTSNNAHPAAIAAALCLATGRRSVEVLLTGSFTLGKNMTSDGYRCLFSGQAKSGLDPIGQYEIPLLARFGIIVDAVKRVRAAWNTEQMTKVQVNLKAAKPIANYLVRLKIGIVNAHALREVYSVAQYSLLEGKKPSMMGFISRILGHSATANAQFYQRMTVIEPMVWPEDVVTKENDELADWEFSNLPEKKRVLAVLEVIAHRVKVTASALRRIAGGSMLLSQRIIDKNAKKIEEYNASL
jgi:predicted RecB family endonuclease